MTKFEFMAMSLPYGLKCYYNNYIKIIVEDIGLNTKRSIEDILRNENYFLILRPLSDFSNSGFDTQDELLVEKLISGDSICSMPFYLIKRLLEEHFDVIGLIEKGEAIDYRTLPDFEF